MAVKKKQWQQRKQVSGGSDKPKHFVNASDPAIQREIEASLKGAAELQAASDKAFRMELATD